MDTTTFALPSDGKLHTRIKPYTGTEDRAQTSAFIMQVESYNKAAGNTAAGKEAQAAGILAGSLTDKAFQWLETLRADRPTVLTSYDDLLQAFKDRYLRALTRTELQALHAGLKQGKKETVMDFKDRCAYVQTIEMEEYTQAEKNTDFFKKEKMKGILDKFMVGLRPEILANVQTQDAVCKDLDAYLLVARNVEIALEKKQQAQTCEVQLTQAATAGDKQQDKKEDNSASLQDQVDKLVAEIRNLRTGGGRNRQNPNRRRNQAAGGNATRNMRCYHCGILGHLKRDCFKRKEIGRAHV